MAPPWALVWIRPSFPTFTSRSRYQQQEFFFSVSWEAACYTDSPERLSFCCFFGFPVFYAEIFGVSFEVRRRQNPFAVWVGVPERTMAVGQRQQEHFSTDALTRWRTLLKGLLTNERSLSR